MQRITTKEPTDDIIEVAIAATKKCLGEDEETEQVIYPVELSEDDES